jgi:hypothetical protein
MTTDPEDVIRRMSSEQIARALETISRQQIELQEEARILKKEQARRANALPNRKVQNEE